MFRVKASVDGSAGESARAASALTLAWFNELLKSFHDGWQRDL